MEMEKVEFIDVSLQYRISLIAHDENLINEEFKVGMLLEY